MRFPGISVSIIEQPLARRSADEGFREEYWTSAIATASSGVVVTPATAKRNAAVYACGRVYCETLASLPLLLYRRLGGSSDRERATEDPLYALLNARPNNFQTRFEFVELLVNHLLFRGNFYALKSLTGRGDVTALIPLNPDMVHVEVTRGEAGATSLQYRLTNANGVATFPASQVLHVKNHSEDGYIGKSVIELAREAIGTALALDRQSNASFSNAARLSGILEHPQILSEEAAQRISKSWKDAYAGTANAGAVAILEEGMSFKPVSMTNADAQFIQSREFQLSEIARIFRMPPHMIQDLSKATYSNIEHMSINFVTHTIRPMAVRIEMALMRDLLPEGKREDYFVEFLLDALMRGDAQSRGEFYSKMFSIGAYSINRILAKENENGIGEDGDKHFVPVNMVPIDKAGAYVDAQLPKSEESSASTVASIRFYCGKMLKHSLARVVTKEEKAIAKAREKGENLTTWLVAFYSEHRAYIKEHLLPVIQICCDQRRLAIPDRRAMVPEAEVESYIERHIAERYSALEADSVTVLDIAVEADKILGAIFDDQAS